MIIKTTYTYRYYKNSYYISLTLLLFLEKANLSLFTVQYDHVRILYHQNFYSFRYYFPSRREKILSSCSVNNVYFKVHRNLLYLS